MATYVLSAVGTAIAGPVGGFIGAALGTLADRAIVAALTPNTSTRVEQAGPQMTELSVTASTEGAVMSKLFGRCRLGGQVIWCADFKEVKETTTTEQTVGGKGGGGRSTTTVTTTVYKYYLSFAVGFCAGNPLASLGQVWFDGTRVDLSKYTLRFYPGSEHQSPDALIQAIQGVDRTPAFRGTAYIVFEDLPLEQWGNRMPQVTAEIVVPLATGDRDDLTNAGRAWALIPGSGETALGTQVYTNQTGYYDGSEFVETEKVLENVHNAHREPDFIVSVNQLMAEQPNLDAVSLVVSWFGTDLRAGECRIVPKVEYHSTIMLPNEWTVAGYVRLTTDEVSMNEQGRPYFGGTPSDETVREAIRYLKANGTRVMLYPFILMDIPPGNALPTPYSDNAATTPQAVFPWRGRITCSPAPGYAGSVDGTAAAASQIETFFTREEGFRRFILHYAAIAEEEDVEIFCIGSEMVGLTQVRGTGGSYPAVDRLCTLADDVRAIFKGQITYAADWSEYHSHRPDDGSGDVIFNMDKLWAKGSIDFIGIDNYMASSDWRDGTDHLDFDPEDGPISIYDRGYLTANIEGGEYYDWYYQSAAARKNQNRTPITDGAWGEPWVWRQKDIRNWWFNHHHDRPGGVRSGTRTAWDRQSKPVWFTEAGCPAVDKGTNQPNVFVDPKSSESFYPHFSNKHRDDLIQRLYLEVMLAYWRDNAPVSSVYHGPMIAPENIFIWCWDARPYPEFPRRSSTWTDGPNWSKGHWLTGRIESAMLPRLVEQLCREVGLDAARIDVSGLFGPGALVRGLHLNSVTDQRGIFEALAKAFVFDMVESEGRLKFRMAAQARLVDIEAGDLVLPDGQDYAVTLTRKQETELPTAAKLTFLDEGNAFQPASVDAHLGTGSSQNVITTSFPIILPVDYARGLATTLIHAAWTGRESGELALPPSLSRLEPGDAIYVPLGNRNLGAQVQSVRVAAERKIGFAGFDASLFTPPPFPEEVRVGIEEVVHSSVRLVFLDLPLLGPSDVLPHAARIAAQADPWPGACTLYREDAAGSYRLVQSITGAAVMGVTETDLWRGPANRWDRGNSFRIRLFGEGGFASVSEAQLLDDPLLNRIAVGGRGHRKWEILQFTEATLIAEGVYELSTLLRGQFGTEDAMADPLASGHDVVALEPGIVVPLEVDEEVAEADTRYRWGPALHPPSDAGFLQRRHAGSRIGLRPYSPCDVAIRRVAASDDLVITWKRRTRLKGDNWRRAEVPLIEEREQYRLEVLSDGGGTVKRSVEVTAPTWSYDAAAQIADFGATRTQIRLRIAQFGDDYGGYGAATEGMFYARSAS